MGFFQQWLVRPQNVFLRRALFQIHLWTGIGAGLYVLLIGVTGSALVFRPENLRDLDRGPRTVEVAGSRLTDEELTAAAKKVFPRHTVSQIWDGKRPEDSVEIWLDQPGAKTTTQSEFNPYTGEYLGSRQPFSIRLSAWILDFHANLLAGKTGQIVNGWGGACLAGLSLTGLVIWWPGTGNWKRSLIVPLGANWKQFNWNLHSAAGFWMFSIVLIFGVTGAYLVFQMPFQRAINMVAPLRQYSQDTSILEEEVEEEDATPAPSAPPTGTPSTSTPGTGAPSPKGDSAEAPSVDAPPPEVRVFTSYGAGGASGRRRPRYSFGDNIIVWMGRLHYGRFAGFWVKWLWVVLGLIPPLLFVTGALMWWNRVLSPSARRAKRNARLATAGSAEFPGIEPQLSPLTSKQSAE